MKRACHDEGVLDRGEMAECAECCRQVRWDLQEHPFFGFHNCPNAPLRNSGESAMGVGNAVEATSQPERSPSRG
jgi:hypothetical protein